jgi:hypothetical protein
MATLNEIFKDRKIVYYHSEDNKFEYNGKFYEFDSRFDNIVGYNIDRTDIIKFLKTKHVVVYMENNKPVAFRPRGFMLETIRNTGPSWLPKFKHMYISFDGTDYMYYMVQIVNNYK